MNNENIVSDNVVQSAISQDNLNDRIRRKKRGTRGKKKKTLQTVTSKVEYVCPYPIEILAIKVDQLNLSDKTKQILKDGNINSVKDIAIRSMRDMYRIQHVNKKICYEILRALDKHDVVFRDYQNEAIFKNVKQAKEDEINNYVLKKITDGIELAEPLYLEETKSDMLRFSKRAKYGLRDKTNKEIIPASYNDIFFPSEDLICVEINDKYGYINMNNEIVIEAKYDMALSFSEGLAVVTFNEKSGYIDKLGNEVIPLEFDLAQSFKNGRGVVKRNTSWGYVTKDGKVSWIHE